MIDSLDARLIELLAAEPRVGVLEASRRLGVARGTVQARLDRLDARGVITGYGPEVDPVALGHGVTAFVTLEMGHEPSPELKEELRAWVAKEIGSMAKPDDIRFTDQLPKTRSGKIMRRLLRELASSGEVKGDVTTLEDMGVISRLQKDEE